MSKLIQKLNLTQVFLNKMENKIKTEIAVTFIRDTNKFCDLTGREIGGFTSGTTTTLHKDIADILILDKRAILSKLCMLEVVRGL